MDISIYIYTCPGQDVPRSLAILCAVCRFTLLGDFVAARRLVLAHDLVVAQLQRPLGLYQVCFSVSGVFFCIRCVFLYQVCFCRRERVCVYVCLCVSVCVCVYLHGGVCVCTSPLWVYCQVRARGRKRKCVPAHTRVFVWFLQ